MTVFGQILGIISVEALLVAVALTVLGRLSFRLLLLTGIATSVLGVMGAVMVGSGWSITLRLVALAASIAAFAIHRRTARRG